MADRHEDAAVLALAKAATALGLEWYRAAVLIDQAGSALRMIKQDWTGFESFDIEIAERLATAVTQDMLAESYELLSAADTRGDKIVTVVNDEYPLNLRRVYNRPPFLFVRGRLLEEDNRAVAVVGTRRASPDGLSQAARLAVGLAQNRVTVLSGLALGIDATAHRAALDAGGRAVAVMGTGIERIYPRENEPLAERILAEGGALVSQFWPDAPPARWSFPLRNVVMSGMAIGTVVIEASPTSGAKMQARLALKHGKRVFLVKSLVMQEDWARRYVDKGAQVIESVDDILETLVSMAQSAEQLTFK
jgi:DNA processing protein